MFDSVHVLLYRYETAMRTLQEVIAAMQTGSWEDAHDLYTTAKATWQEIKDSCDIRFEKENFHFNLLAAVRWIEFQYVCSHQEQLPVFLRCFTVGWTYTRIMSRGVEISQRLRRYDVGG